MPWSELLTRFDALAVKMQAAAPVVWDKLLALELAKSQVEAILLFVSFLTPIALYKAGWKVWAAGSRALEKERETVIAYNANSSRYDTKRLPDDTWHFTLAVGLFICAGVLACVHMIWLYNSKWTWVGLISPESRLINDLWLSLVR